MALQAQFQPCSFCLHNITKRRHVKGSIRLKHSGSSVSEFIDRVMGIDVPVIILCFKCYKLIYSIDYHHHEFKRLQESVMKIYKERCFVVEKIKDPEFCRTVLEYTASIASEASKNRTEVPISSNTPLSDTIQPKGKDQSALSEHQQLPDSELVISSENASPIKTGDINQKRDNCSADQELKQTNFGDNAGDQKFSQEQNKYEEIVSTSYRYSKRRKSIKKFDDYEYYTDSSKDLNDLDPSVNSGNKLTISETKLSETGKLCTLCHKVFTLRKDYSHHPCIQKMKNSVSLICKGCQMPFSVRQHYIRHINSCYKNVPVKCHLCLVELQSAAYLPRHLEAYHNGSTVTQKSSLCDQCGRIFSRKEALQRHQAKVHGVSHGTYQCSRCGQTFPHTSLLMEHMRAHKGYHCPECKKMFTCMSNLTLHKQTFHQNKSMYFCSTCNKRWRFHTSYTNHMRKVHGKAQHKCPYCKLLFSAENALYKHKEVCEVAFKKAEEDQLNSKSGAQRKEQNSYNPAMVTGSSAFQGKVYTTTTYVNKRIESNYKKSGKNFLPPQNISGIHQSPESYKIPTVAKSETITSSDVKYQDLYSVTKKGEELEECPLLCPDNGISSSSEIVLETLEELSSDCQYVILVEDSGSEQK